MNAYAPGQIVAATGHRPQHLSLEDGYWLQTEFDRLVDKLNPSLGISGMALGVDTWWAVACLSHDVPLHCYIPFKGQEVKWRKDDRLFYEQILAEATEVKYFGEAYNVRLFHVRDRAMVDDSNILVAGWNGKQAGGTFATREYAVKLDRPIVTVDPARRTVTARKLAS